jgi:uncharacterized membrane protein
MSDENKTSEVIKDFLIRAFMLSMVIAIVGYLLYLGGIAVAVIKHVIFG